jgi:hypothetical protein
MRAKRLILRGMRRPAAAPSIARMATRLLREWVEPFVRVPLLPHHFPFLAGQLREEGLTEAVPAQHFAVANC